VADGVASGVQAANLTIGQGAGDAALLAFDLVPGSPDCVASANVELQVVSATPATELGIYPSGVTDAAVLADGNPVAGELVLDRAGAPLAFTDGTPGRLRWDVTALYRTWALGQAFPGGATVDPGTPFTVAVRATDEGFPGRAIVFQAAQAASDGPTLAWTGVPGCGEG